MTVLPKTTPALMMCVLLLAGCQSTSSTRLADGEKLPINTENPAAVYLELATSYLESGQPGAALSNARKAVAVDPDNPEALILQGVAQSNLGHIEDAEKSYRQALAKSQNGPYAANAYGTFLCGQRRYEEAVTQFDAAAASPQNLSPWLAITNSALCLSEQGKTKEAKARFLRALQSNARFGPALLGLARAHYRTGDYAEARTYVNRYFEVASPDPESLLLGYQIEKAIGNRKVADSYELMLKSRFPDSPQTYRLLGL